MSSLRLGAQLSLALLRTSKSFWLFSLGLLASCLAAGLERGEPNAVRNALAGMVCGLVLPLSALSLSAWLTQHASLYSAFAEPLRWGNSPRRLFWGWACPFVSLLCLLGFFFAAASAWLAGAAPIAAGSAGGIGAWAGLVYACSFAAASSFGRHGQGRLVWLGSDWIFGAGVGGFSVIFPRSHIMNLLGGPPPLDLPQWASHLALILLSVLALCLASLRLPR